MAKKKDEKGKGNSKEMVIVQREDKGGKKFPYTREIAERLVRKGLGKIVKVVVTEEKDEKPKNTKNPGNPPKSKEKDENPDPGNPPKGNDII